MTKRRKGQVPWSWRPKRPAARLSDAAQDLLCRLREAGALHHDNLSAKDEEAADELEDGGYVEWSDDGFLILREDR